MALILYVEDHPPAQLLMTAIIGELTAHQVVCFGNAETALGYLGLGHQPQLYIVDMDLPDSDGIGLIYRLRAAHLVPAILVSAYAEAINIAAHHAHISHYLAKPLDPTHVATIIERAIAR
jgi:CheY-like chemotaxis protein